MTPVYYVSSVISKTFHLRFLQLHNTQLHASPSPSLPCQDKTKCSVFAKFPQYMPALVTSTSQSHQLFAFPHITRVQPPGFRAQNLQMALLGRGRESLFNWSVSRLLSTSGVCHSWITSSFHLWDEQVMHGIRDITPRGCNFPDVFPPPHFGLCC